MIKKYDIVATTSTYIKDGETKKRYKNVGAIMEKNGNIFMLLERTFNPAGLPNEGKDNVLLSLYAPKNDEGQQPLDDHIPF